MWDMLAHVVAASGTTPPVGGDSVSIPGGDVASIVGLLNYGVLGILAVGFIRGWVVSPRERDRLEAHNAELKKENADKDAEIARLNKVMQDNLQAMVATTDKQIELWSRRREGPRGDQ